MTGSMTTAKKNLISAFVCAAFSLLFWVLLIESIVKGSQYYGANQFVAYLATVKPYFYAVMIPVYVLFFYCVLNRAAQKELKP